MDVISGVASVFAVVSLAIQLAQSTQDVSRFLRSITDAPKEVDRLISLLEQLQLILDGVQALNTKQMEQDGVPDLRLSAIFTALQKCRNNLEPLESLLKKAKDRLKNSSKLARTWASFKFTLKKKDVEDFQNRLQQAMLMIQTALTINVTQMLISIVQGHNMTALTEILSILQSSVASDPVAPNPTGWGNHSSSAPKTDEAMVPVGNRRAHHTWRQAVNSSHCYITPLGTFFYRTNSTYSRSDRQKSILSQAELDTQETRATYIPSFLGRCIEFRFRNAYGSISRTLNTYPVLDYSAPIFQLCRIGNIRALQTLFSERKISPFSVTPDGYSLLHMAALTGQADICKFLLQLGLDSNYATYNGRNALYLSIRGNSLYDGSDKYTSTARTLVDLGQTDLLSMHVSTLIWRPKTPIEVCEYLFEQDMAEVGLIDADHRLGLWLHCLLLNVNITDNEGCKSVIRRLVVKGAHLHAPCLNRRTPLDSLFMHEKEAWESQYLADQWLGVLFSAGIDLEEYLGAEMQLHPEPHLTLDYRGRKRQLIFSLRDPPRVRWEWWIDLKGIASMVLDEYKDTGPVFDIFNVTVKFDQQWPYEYSDWQQHALMEDMLRYPRIGNYKNPERSERIKLADERFQRRMQRKAIKFGKAERKGMNRRIPGAWID